MFGIVYPKDWREIINRTEISRHFPSNNNLRKSIENSLKQILFSNDQAVLCLSGGVDSSVVAVLLKNLKSATQCFTIACHPHHPDIAHAGILTKTFSLSHLICLHHPTPEDNCEDMYEILFSTCHRLGYNEVICCDTIDEMIGGYWAHQEPVKFFSQQNISVTHPEREIFDYYWQRLITNHLEPLDIWSKHFKIKVNLVYLNREVIQAVQKYPLNQRTDQLERKKPLKQIARDIGVPDVIINRKKLGLCDILKNI